MYREGSLIVESDFDKQLLETDIGEHGIYEGEKVIRYDCRRGRKEYLNKPKRGDKVYVFVKDGDKSKKVTGDTTGLKSS